MEWKEVIFLIRPFIAETKKPAFLLNYLELMQ